MSLGWGFGQGRGCSWLWGGGLTRWCWLPWGGGGDQGVLVALGWGFDLRMLVAVSAGGPMVRDLAMHYVPQVILLIQYCRKALHLHPPEEHNSNIIRSNNIYFILVINFFIVYILFGGPLSTFY